MTDRPIIFSAPMVRALLDGRKTQTRRILKRQPACDGVEQHPDFASEWVPYKDGEPQHSIVVPYAIGDRLYVRETHWRLGQWLHQDGGWHFEPTPDYGPVFYAPPGAKGTRFAGEHGWWQRPAIFHERRDSRLTLTVTDVRVQRPQEISGEDAKAEGARHFPDIPDKSLSARPDRWSMEEPPDTSHCLGSARFAFANYWVKLHRAREHDFDAWDANPWVVALTFTAQQRNIDAGRG